VKRKRLVIIIVSFLAAIVLAALLWPREREPEYDGELLSVWLRRYKTYERVDAPSANEALTAIRQIGTNAIPWLTKWVVFEPSKTKLQLLRYIEKFPSNLQRPLQALIGVDWKAYSRQELATLGFQALGSQARSAVPELVRVLVHRKSVYDYSIISALQAIGDDSIPPIVNIFADLANPKELRIRAVHWLGALHTANSFTTSNLVACIQKQDPEVGLASAQALAHSQREMEIVLPFLTNHAGDANATIRMNVATCIGAYGSKAASALPILLELLKDPSRDVRDSATNAVYVIDPTLLPPGTIPSRPFIE
jgi:HEAT repeat protein